MPQRIRPAVTALAASMLVLAGCKQGAKSAPGPAPAKPAAGASATEASGKAATGGEGAAVTDAAVAKYAAYQQAFIARLEVLAKDWANRQVPDNADPDELSRGHRALVDAARVAARQQVSLDAAEEERLFALASAVASDRLLYAHAGGDEALKQLDVMERRIAEMPPEERARAQAEHRESKQILEDLKNLRRARSRYGDASVDRVLAHPEVIANQEKLERLMAQGGD